MLFPMLTTQPLRSLFAAMTSVLALTVASQATAQDRPSLNFYGTTGLIDMPSGEAQPDAILNATSAHFGPISRTTLTFQLSPRLSASFRYSGVRKWDDVVGSRFSTYYDRSFDLRYQVFTETQYRPAVTIGFQDFVGTGLLSGEYIAATKHLTPNLKVTGGLGWGRLGSYGAIGAPLGNRDQIDVDQGGKFNLGQWFRGDAAPFAGVEYQAGDKWTLKAEYSSDAYLAEADQRQTFDRKSPFSFGAEYKLHESLRVGAYYMYGSEFGLSLQFAMNPKQRPMGGVADSAPDPIKPRPSRGADPDAWSPEWVTQDGAAPVLITNINKRLEKEGVTVEAIGYTGTTAQVRIRNTRYDAEAQAIGRVARAMTHVMPASVEVFEIVPLVNGVPTSKVTIRRSDLEALEFSPNAADAIRARTGFGDGRTATGDLTYDPELYPRFNWSLGPTYRISFFDPNAPVQAGVGIRLAGRAEVTPNIVLSGALISPMLGNIGNTDNPSTSVLPHVRSEGSRYNSEGEFTIDHLTMAWYGRPAEQIYSRVTLGYLERMFGGISGEVLWKPVEGRLALGAELNYVKQRDYNQLLGFQDYGVMTGHVSAYYEVNDNYHAQLDVGRYLAGDVGATLSVDREFANGWKVGAFATLTDVSAEDFGEGSFDKGIRLEVPITWGIGTPSRNTIKSTLRPLSRDGGAKLEVSDRLYDTVRDYQGSSLDAQWGRFWK